MTTYRQYEIEIEDSGEYRTRKALEQAAEDTGFSVSDEYEIACYEEGEANLPDGVAYGMTFGITVPADESETAKARARALVKKVRALLDADRLATNKAIKVLYRDAKVSGFGYKGEWKASKIK